jgi:DNA mismatch repair protein MSH3
MQLLSSGGGGASLSSPAAVAASPFRSRLSSEKLSLPSTVSEGSLDPKAHREYVDKMMAREMSVESRSNPAQFNSYESSFVLGGSGGGGSGGGGGAAAAAAAAATSSSSPNATSGGGFHLPASFDLVRWSGVAGTTASSKFTPLETQVLALKQRHPDVLLLVEVGYKFRFFGRDAEVAAHLLDIYAHPSHHLLTASIPTFRLYIHVKRLLEAGLKVGVVRQTESAASKKAEKQGAAAAAAKDGKKKGGAASSTGPLFTRGISELYTKATSVPELGDEGEGMLRSSVPSRYLLCLFEEPAAASYGELDAASRVRCSIVGVDPTTGEVVWDAFETGFLRTELHTRLAQLAPAEVLVSSRPNTLSANSASMLVAFAEAQAAAAGSAAATEAVRLEKLDGKKFKFEYNEAAAIISRFLDDAQEQATAMGGGKQQEQPRDIEVLDGDEDESKGGAGAAASAMPTTSTPTTLESLNLPKGVVICLGQLIPYLRSFGLEGAFRSLVAARAAPSSATAAAAAAGAPTSAASSSPSFHRFRLASQALQLDALALHNLEVVRSQEGQAQGSLLWLLSHTKTSFGARKLREMVLHPLANQEAIVARLDAVDELLSADTTWPSNLTPVMHQLPDLERGLARVQYGQCKPLEFLRLLEALQKVVHAYPDARTIASMRASLFRDLFASVDFPALKSTVQGLLASLNPAAVEQDRKADFFADPSLFPEIAQAKRDILAIEAELAAHLVAARKLLGPDYARLEYLAVNNIEFLIEVKQADVKRVPKSWVQQNATKVKVRYHPPEVSAALDRLLLAREHLVNVSNAAWRTFLASFSSHYALLRPCIELLGTLDCLLSLAVVAALPGYVRPDILDSTAAASSSAETGSGDSGGAGGGGAVLDVKGGRHPMIEAAWMGASGGSFVPNDIEMNAAGPRFYVISGANMGGKCWGRDTRLMLHNGRSMSVQSIVQRMQRGESVELMGDDGTPRRTILGTQTIGNTADNGAGAATYRIMSDNSARDTWSVHSAASREHFTTRCASSLRAHVSCCSLLCVCVCVCGCVCVCVCVCGCVCVCVCV